MFDSDEYLGGFLQRHFNETLVINGNKDTRTGLDHSPLREPRGALTIRYEPDTKMMFIAAKKFKEYCVTYQINYKETLNKLKAEGIFIRSDTKRMTKGMKVTTTGV